MTIFVTAPNLDKTQAACATNPAVRALFLSSYSETTHDAARAQVCATCPILEPCRTHARRSREPGFWGGENEAARAPRGTRIYGRPIR